MPLYFSNSTETINILQIFQVKMKHEDEEETNGFYLPCLSRIEYQEASYRKLKQITMETLNNSVFFCNSKCYSAGSEVTNILVSESTATLTTSSQFVSTLVEKYHKLVDESTGGETSWWLPDAEVVVHPPLSHGF